MIQTLQISIIKQKRYYKSIFLNKLEPDNNILNVLENNIKKIKNIKNRIFLLLK